MGGAASAHMSHNMSGLRPLLLLRHWLIVTGPRAISARIFYLNCIIVLSVYAVSCSIMQFHSYLDVACHLRSNNKIL